jgi:hypothetical protein
VGESLRPARGGATPSSVGIREVLIGHLSVRYPHDAPTAPPRTHRNQRSRARWSATSVDVLAHSIRLAATTGPDDAPIPHPDVAFVGRRV